ncbi:Imm8 family immunity protein [Moraxella porci]|nr:Imm8 family immunity protein [Moraxella porci]MDH2273511.1 Imm8 family immunity protein [Moraxella porci]
MILEVKSLYSPDVFDLKLFRDIGEPFSILLEVVIGEKNKDGGDIFSFTIVNISFLEEMINEDEVIFGKNMIIVKRFDYIQIVNRISKLINHLSSNDWEEFVVEFSRYADWEFEGYQDV